MSAQAPTVHLSVESRPQALTLVRGMLAGVADPLGIEAELLDDLKTAVSEACNNVVLHAYGADTGPMTVQVFARPDLIRVTVEDEGVGISNPGVEPGAGIGLSVIRALTETMETGPGSRGGTRITMDFATSRAEQPLFAAPPAAAPAPEPALPDGDEIVISLSPVSLLAAVLGRMARTLAATAHFSLDRFSDVYLITDTLAAHARRAAVGPRVTTRLWGAERRLELEIGPLASGSSVALTASPLRESSPLALLADELSSERRDHAEILRVVVLDRRQ